MLHESSITDPIITLRNTFHHTGYLFIRSFFPLHLITSIRELVIDVLHQERWGQWAQDAFIAIEPVHRINSPGFYQCIRRLMEKEALHDLSQHPSLCALLSALLEEPIYPHPRKMVRITYPYTMNPKDRVPPHQDIVYVKGEQDTFTTWIPLGDYPPEHGGLEVAPYSHKQGLYPIQANHEGRFGCTAIEEHVTDIPWHHTHYRIGDILIMHSLTLHRSGINDTASFRLSLDCRFSSAMKTINEDQLLPPYYPHVPHWDTLSSTWTNPTRFAPPTTIIPHSHDQPLDQVLMTSSRFTI